MLIVAVMLAWAVMAIGALYMFGWIIWFFGYWIYEAFFKKEEILSNGYCPKLQQELAREAELATKQP